MLNRVVEKFHSSRLTKLFQSTVFIKRKLMEIHFLTILICLET
ncbi:hypothetical protein LEP1GSC021_1766 [Leptospira noguchii str. 1993005606]|nr:hypothetical protein LEP1GSC021_1766 [Leptospira noguchii str. 1993005606]